MLSKVLLLVFLAYMIDSAFFLVEIDIFIKSFFLCEKKE